MKTLILLSKEKNTENHLYYGVVMYVICPKYSEEENVKNIIKHS